MALASLQVMEEEDLVQRLQSNIRTAHEVLARHGLRVPPSPTGIVPIPIGDEKETIRIAIALDQEGLFVNPSIYPAVPARKGILRVNVSAHHTQAQIERVFESIHRFSIESIGSDEPSP